MLYYIILNRNNDIVYIIFCIIIGSIFLQKSGPFVHTENVQKLYKIYTESIQKLYRNYFCMFSVYFLDPLFFIGGMSIFSFFFTRILSQLLTHSGESLRN